MGKGFLYGSPRDEPSTVDIKVAAYQYDAGSPATYIQAASSKPVPNLTVTNAAVSVDTTSGGVELSAASDRWVWRCFMNNGSQTIYLGTGSVTTSNGFPIDPGQSFTDPASCVQWKAIVATGSADVRTITMEAPAS